jgi:Uma2 family endonuclease
VSADELRIDLAGYGSMTFRSPGKRGLVPDGCYWFTHEAQMRNRTHIDFRVDPPPELVVEVDLLRSAINRMAIYARLGVPEVWRLNRKGLTFQLLQPDRTYAEGNASRAFPFLPAGDVSSFMARRRQVSETALMRGFRAWVRQRMAGGAPSP